MAIVHLLDNVYLLAQHLVAPGTVTLLHAFLVLAEQSLIVDTSAPPWRAEVLDGLRKRAALLRLRYVAITHADPDHTGALVALLDAAPQARILTNPMGQVKLAGDFGLPAERFQVVVPGDTVDLGDRQLSVHRVPLYDQPETMGYFDTRSRVFFAADCFGAILPEVVAFADEVDDTVYRAGFVDWNVANHPWVRLVDEAKFAREVDAIRRLQPRVLASAHGPIIRQDVDRALDWLAALPHEASASDEL